MEPREKMQLLAHGFVLAAAMVTIASAGLMDALRPSEYQVKPIETQLNPLTPSETHYNPEKPC